MFSSLFGSAHGAFSFSCRYSQDLPEQPAQKLPARGPPAPPFPCGDGGTAGMEGREVGWVLGKGTGKKLWRCHMQCDRGSWCFRRGNGAWAWKELGRCRPWSGQGRGRCCGQAVAAGMGKEGQTRGADGTLHACLPAWHCPLQKGHGARRLVVLMPGGLEYLTRIRTFTVSSSWEFLLWSGL